MPRIASGTPDWGPKLNADLDQIESTARAAQQQIANHTAAPAAHEAEAITLGPVEGVTATTVQAALAELAARPSIPGPPGEPGAPGAPGADGGTDAATAGWVESGPLTKAALSATIATASAAPGSLLTTSLVTEGAGIPRPVDHFGGYFWGAVDGAIWRSADGITWTKVNQTLGSGFARLFPCADGELLAVLGNTTKKSSGWSTDPATATWAVVLTLASGFSTTEFQVDSDETGQRFILGEYKSPPDGTSNKVRMSLDAGSTWSVVWDGNVTWPTDSAGTHLHGFCFDKYAGGAGRWWFTYAHDPDSEGFYYSDNDGATWTRTPYAADVPVGAPPTVLLATPAGIVGGSDSLAAALYIVPRDADPSRMRPRILARWRDYTTAGGQNPGFASSGCIDRVTGIAYVLMNSTGGDATKAVHIWATDGTHSEVVYSHATGAGDPSYAITANDGIVLAGYSVAGVRKILTATAQPRTPVEPVSNAGNVGGGIAVPTSVAVGNTAAPLASSVAVGDGVVLSGLNTVAVGRGARATGNSAVAVGRSSTATANSVVMGHNASTGGSGHTVIGHGATTTGGQDSVVIGNGAASGGYARSVVLGRGSAGVLSATSNDQVKVGDKHIELAELAADPAAPAVSLGRLYLKDNGSGKTQLCVRFNTGAVVILATEP